MCFTRSRTKFLFKAQRDEGRNIKYALFTRLRLNLVSHFFSLVGCVFFILNSGNTRMFSQKIQIHMKGVKECPRALHLYLKEKV